MIEEFLKAIKESFSKEEVNRVEAVLELLKSYDFGNQVYDIEFAVQLASMIFNNKLGYKAVLAGLYFLCDAHKHFFDTI